MQLHNTLYRFFDIVHDDSDTQTDRRIIAVYTALVYTPWSIKTCNVISDNNSHIFKLIFTIFVSLEIGKNIQFGKVTT